MPTVEQMMEKYKDLMETSKSCYIHGHDTLYQYLKRLDTHYEYIRGYLSALYVYNFMTDKEFNKLTDEIFNIHTEYQNIILGNNQNE